MHLQLKALEKTELEQRIGRVENFLAESDLQAKDSRWSKVPVG